MIVEMHCHTAEHSNCSIVPAGDLVKKAFQVGIQTIVFTDHHYQWENEELDSLRKRTGVPDFFKILSGQEITTFDFGDVLVYGAEKTYLKQKISLTEIREQNPDAAIIWAHPYRNGKIPGPDRLLSYLIDGVEIFNSNYSIVESGKALKDWHTFKFTGIGGTDTHAYSYTGSYPTIFDHPVQSIRDLVDELKAGRCRPYFKEIQKAGTSNTKVTELTIGPRSAEDRKELIIKNFDDFDSWKQGERSFHLVKELLKHSFDEGTYRIPRPLGKDVDNLSVFEERIEGRNLFDAIVQSEPNVATRYLQMAARWLSKLHNLSLKISPAHEYLQVEPERTEYYLKSLIMTKNKYLQRVREIKEMVLTLETGLIEKRPELLVQGHGDYHPKNIYIRKEDQDEFIAAIDFDSSFQLPRAFDVGTFLAQYVNMFFKERDVQKNAPSEIFLETYLATANNLENDFMNHVHLFRARTCLSILYYLAKIEMGDTENFFRIMVEAEKNLAAIL
jgi:3',5'-nucleoside bisphosphate phosphatase